MSKIFTVSRPCDAPLIQVEQDLVENQISLTVADIEVLTKDGTYSRFFVSAKIRNGRPVLELSTNNNRGGSTRKSVTGFKRERS